MQAPHCTQSLKVLWSGDVDFSHRNASPPSFLAKSICCHLFYACNFLRRPSPTPHDDDDDVPIAKIYSSFVKIVMVHSHTLGCYASKANALNCFDHTLGNISAIVISCCYPDELRIFYLNNLSRFTRINLGDAQKFPNKCASDERWPTTSVWRISLVLDSCA